MFDVSIGKAKKKPKEISELYMYVQTDEKMAKFPPPHPPITDFIFFCVY